MNVCARACVCLNRKQISETTMNLIIYKNINGISAEEVFKQIIV